MGELESLAQEFKAKEEYLRASYAFYFCGNYEQASLCIYLAYQQRPPRDLIWVEREKNQILPANDDEQKTKAQKDTMRKAVIHLDHKQALACKDWNSLELLLFGHFSSLFGFQQARKLREEGVTRLLAKYFMIDKMTAVPALVKARKEGLDKP